MILKEKILVVIFFSCILLVQTGLAQKMGIGTATPDGILHLDNGTSDTDFIIEKDDIPRAEIKFNMPIVGEKASIKFDGDENLEFENDNSDTDIIFKVNDGSVDTEVMRIDGSSSSVGIGVAAPAKPLAVAGAMQVGVASTTTGSIVWQHSASAFTTTVQSGVTTASHTLTLYTNAPTVGYFVANDGAGQLSWRTYTDMFAAIADAAVDATWEDKDLTALGVPDGAVVEILMKNTKDNKETNAGVRTNGSALARMTQIREAEGGGGYGVTMLVKTDAAGVIEVYAEKTGDIDFWVIGYW